MNLALACIAWLVLVQPAVAAERAKSPSDATVLIRLVGSVRAEIEFFGQKEVINRDRIEIGSGSGFVISPDGHVLTNEHVVSNSEIIVSDGFRKATINVKVSQIEVCYPRREHRRTERHRSMRTGDDRRGESDLDLAILYVNGSNQPYLALGDSDVVTSGQPVQALGFPYGRSLNIGRNTLDSVVPDITTTVGTISALRTNESGERRVLQIDANINPGNSGGPVINKDGFVVGVMRARLRDATGIAFAIPINQAKSFIESRGLDQLMPVRRLRLGGVQRLEAKGLALRLPEGMSDASQFRSHVESDSTQADVALRLDRVLSPWTLGRLEQELIRDPDVRANLERQQRQPLDARQRRHRAARPRLGNARNGAEVGMAYAVIDLGREKMLARFVGPAEHLAFNESVLRDSLTSVDAERLLAGELEAVEKIEWHAASAERRVPVPVG